MHNILAININSCQLFDLQDALTSHVLTQPWIPLTSELSEAAPVLFPVPNALPAPSKMALPLGGQHQGPPTALGMLGAPARLHCSTRGASEVLTLIYHHPQSSTTVTHGLPGVIMQQDLSESAVLLTIHMSCSNLA